MKFYIGDQLVRVDMVHRYRYAVLEGDRVITLQRNRNDANAAAEYHRAIVDDTIRRFEAALKQDELTRMPSSQKISRDIWDDYHSSAEIYAAIVRIKKRRDNIRVLPLRIEK